jgi:hypothetical protein
MKGTVLGLIKDMKYYFCQESVNMRKGIEGLCGVIRGSLLVTLSRWKYLCFSHGTGNS